MHRVIRLLILPLIIAFCAVSTLSPTAKAAVIETQTVLHAQPSSTQDPLQALLARDDVYNQLVSLGVDPDFARKRLAALTEQEVSHLQQHIEELPAAGSDFFVVLGIVFAILIALELFGVTNIFRTR